MKLLLDTHAFLWYVSADSRLPDVLREVIRDPSNEIHLSVVSVWEALVKHALGKLPLPSSPAVEYLQQSRAAHRIATLPLEESALTYLAQLPSLHRDPFDRILVAQALEHGLTLVTLEEAVRVYPVPLFPNINT